MAEWRQAKNVGVSNGGLGDASNYAWWVGQDGNIWANIGGAGVENLGRYDAGNATSKGTLAQSINGGPGLAVLDNSRRIADPNAPAENPKNTNDDGGGGGNKTTAEEEARKNNMRSLYDRQIQDINDHIGLLDGKLKNTLAGIDNEYSTYKNEQQTSYNSNKNNYDKSTLQNRQSLQSNRNDITDRASMALRGLLNVLGAMGASGGSEARYTIPDLVMGQANKEFSNAGKVYRQNQQDLDTDWGNYQNEFENDKKKLEDWYNGQVKSEKQKNYEEGQSLLSDLVTALGNRAQYGGNYSSNFNDAYNRIADYRNKIAELGQFTPTKYTGMTSVYNAPDLASYDTGNTNLSGSIVESDTSASSPLLVALQGLNKKKTNSPYNNIGA